MEKDFASPVEEALNEGFIRASKQIQKQFKIGVAARATSIEACPKDGHRMRVANELAVGIMAPFSGKLSGHLVFVVSWGTAQKIWSEVLGSAPLTPNHLNSDHLKLLLEAAGQLSAGFLEVVKDWHDLSGDWGSPTVAIEMTPTILQSMTVEAVRRKMAIMPYRVSLTIADVDVQGQVFAVTTNRGFRNFLQRRGVAA